MAASDTTFKEVADILVRELGLAKARDISRRLAFVQGNRSFCDTTFKLKVHLLERKEEQNARD